MNESDRTAVNWPPAYRPETSPIYAVNEIEVSASPAAVWALLVHAYDWPTYYPHAEVSDISSGSALDAGATFVMQTAGVALRNTVREFVPMSRIAWEALYDTSSAYHGWVITPTPTGCHIRTEETQQGPFWVGLDAKDPGGLHRFHQDWVEGLAAAAASAPG